MARIPNDELDRLKREISVERLAEAHGVALERHGKDLLGLCPFHDDREPSLVISPKKNLWHCLGACQAGGSVIDWVMKARGVSFRHAVELLRADLPAETMDAAPEAAKPGQPSLPAPVDVDADDVALLDQVVAFYHQTLVDSDEARAYLGKRGLDHPEVIEHFQLGFANRTLGYRLPKKEVKAGRTIRGRLQEVGILRPSGHEHFNGSLVIPVFDAHGHVAEIYGRKLRDNLRKGTPLHLYLPGPHRGIFNGAALRAADEVILCESLIDALTFWCAGFRHVTSAYGTKGFTDEILAALVEHGVERVLIAFDHDDAGNHAADAVATKLLGAGIGAYRVRFPQGMDANEYAAAAAVEDGVDATTALDECLRTAQWLGKGEPPTERVPRVDVTTAVAAAESEAAKGKTQLSPLAASASDSAAEPTDEGDVTAGGGEASTREGAPSSLPAPAPAALPIEVSEHEVTITIGDRTYRVRGLAKNLAYDVLKVNLLASRGRGDDAGFHVDTLDLYAARQRHAFIKQAALELAIEPRVAKRDVGRVLLVLEQLQDEQIKQTLEGDDETTPTMTSAERAAAEALLEDEDLLGRIVADFGRCGMVGEARNALIGYLAAVSRKLPRPLAVVVQSSSAAGKSALMEAVLALMPEEERVQYSAMTGQSLFYMGETELKHKILAVAEEEGAERASYALKLLQSEGELRIASTGKDPQSGKLVTHEYRVEGPVMIFLTTTAIDVDEELLNRCLVLTVDEARAQTRAIHAAQRQRRTLEGLVAGRQRDAVVTLHRNAQRLLRPLAVVNPYAHQLTFGDAMTRARRDHEKYLTLIDTIALLHQRQRPVKTATIDTTLDETLDGAIEGGEVEYIEVTLEDIEAANQLAHEVLGRTLDELPPQTRRLLHQLDDLVGEVGDRDGIDRQDFRFTRRFVREATGWGDTQLKVHLGRLVDLEYLAVHRAPDHAQRLVYALLYAGKTNDGRPRLPHLIDVRTLRRETHDSCGSEPDYDANRSASDEDRTGRGPRPVGHRSASAQGAQMSAYPGLCAQPVGPVGPLESIDTGIGKTAASYVGPRRRPALVAAGPGAAAAGSL